MPTKKPASPTVAKQTTERKGAPPRVRTRKSSSPQGNEAESSKPRPRTGIWKQPFLAALSATGIVTSACQAAGIARGTYYRERQNNAQFASDCREAIETAADIIEYEAHRRGVDGIEVPVFRQGIQVGVIWKYSDSLLLALLAARLPKRYGRQLQRKPSEREQKPKRDRTAFSAKLKAIIASRAET